MQVSTPFLRVQVPPLKHELQVSTSTINEEIITILLGIDVILDKDAISITSFTKFATIAGLACTFRLIIDIQEAWTSIQASVVRTARVVKLTLLSWCELWANTEIVHASQGKTVSFVLAWVNGTTSNFSNFKRILGDFSFCIYKNSSIFTCFTIRSSKAWLTFTIWWTTAYALTTLSVILANNFTALVFSFTSRSLETSY